MKWKICAALFACLITLTACIPDYSADEQSPQLNEPQPAAQEALETSIEPVNQIRLAYNAADSLNPYMMKSQINHELTPLLYDSLTRSDKSYRPQNQLAQEIIMEGDVCTVKFNRKAQFSDGTLLTGKDIIYSINTAIASDTNWKTMLQNIAGCSVTAEGDVEIRLGRADADFPALLSFPIIKEGTSGNDFPTGVSKFYLSGMDGNDAILSANHLYYGDTGDIKTIRLTHATDPDSLAFNLKTGDIDLLFADMRTSEFPSLSASSVPVMLNSLVYVGVNSTRGLLSRPEFRQAISTALNRDEIVSKAFVSRASGTAYPFNPDFYRMEGMELSTPRNLTQADALLDGIGLTERDANGFRTYNRQPITLSLLVNSENTSRNMAATLMAEQLAQIGIKLKVESKSFSQYQASLLSLNFDLYLGEVRLMDNMDFSPLLNGGALGYGTAFSEDLANLYRSYRASGTGVKELCDTFSAQTPFIPVVFRHGQILFSREFQAEIVATEQDIFYNITEW